MMIELLKAVEKRIYFYVVCAVTFCQIVVLFSTHFFASQYIPCHIHMRRWNN